MSIRKEDSKIRGINVFSTALVERICFTRDGQGYDHYDLLEEKRLIIRRRKNSEYKRVLGTKERKMFINSSRRPFDEGKLEIQLQENPNRTERRSGATEPEKNSREAKQRPGQG